jgi:hypothetical protein
MMGKTEIIVATEVHHRTTVEHDLRAKRTVLYMPPPIQAVRSISR